jgi:HAD superfamily hydrolase (TIGR01509 family)
MSKPNPELVMLDYAGVITAGYAELDYPAELAQKFGITTDAFVVTNRETQAMARLCIGELTEAEVSAIVVSQNPDAQPIAPGDFVTANYAPCTEVLAELDRIKRAGNRKLALVSNIFPASVKYLEERGVGSYFDYLFLSCQMGSKKPEQAYFSAVLEACGVEPSGCIFLDDTYGNIEAAEQLGIPSRHIQSNKQVLEILGEL